MCSLEKQDLSSSQREHNQPKRIYFSANELPEAPTALLRSKGAPLPVAFRIRLRRLIPGAWCEASEPCFA